MTFNELGIDSRILKAIEELGFERAMPVQEAVLPVLLEKDTDIVALAQTGTGKTAAFGLPLIQKVNLEKYIPETLVLCPTRELCLQITSDLKNFSKYLNNIKIVPVYGGASIEIQMKQLSKGVNIIVATPGRMVDMLKRGKINLSEIKYVVLDEADEMLDMGFQEEINEILKETPKTKNTLLFSATMPAQVEKIARGYMNNPTEIIIGTRNSGAENVKHYYYVVHAKDRYLALKRIVDYYPDIYGIVFCRTRKETQEVADWLIKDGYNADSLHGDLSQVQRDNVMNKFRIKNLQILVATDVAARGLDVNDLTHVINYNLPDEKEAYTHRSGRTGRADKTGISIAIINLREKNKIKDIEKQLGKNFKPAKVPTGKEICEKQLFSMIDKVENVDVIENEVADFLPVVFKKLNHLSIEDLIKRFVSVEFNRFLNYYRDASDLNIPEKFTNESISGKNEKFTRFFINLGKMDELKPTHLIGIINDVTQTRDIKVGKIEILKTFSFFEVESNYTDLLLSAFKKVKYGDRVISLEISSSRNKTDKKNFRFNRYGKFQEKNDDSSEKQNQKRRNNKNYRSDKKQTTGNSQNKIIADKKSRTGKLSRKRY